jgi:hypothetical protein
MQFYRLLFKEAWKLTRQSAFVRSGILWTPVPLVASMFFVVVFISLVGTAYRMNGITAIAQIWQSLLVATLITLAGFLATFLLEAVCFAPTTVLQNAANDPPLTAYWGKAVAISHAFREVSASGAPIRIISAPENAVLHAMLRQMAMSQGCIIANDREDLNPQADVDLPASQRRVGIIIHALPKNTAQRDALMQGLAQ